MLELIKNAFENNAVMSSILSAIVVAFPVLVGFAHKMRKIVKETIGVLGVVKESLDVVEVFTAAADPNSPGGKKFTNEEIEGIRGEIEEAKQAIENSAVIQRLLSKVKD